jgi:hypothetical protein
MNRPFDAKEFSRLLQAEREAFATYSDRRTAAREAKARSDGANTSAVWHHMSRVAEQAWRDVQYQRLTQERS